MKKNTMILLLIFNISLFAQTKFNKEYLKNYFRDTQNVITSPLHWQKIDWVKTCIVSGITVGLYNLADKKMREEIQNNRSDFLDNFANGPRLLGDGFFIFGSQSLLFFYGIKTDNSNLKKAALLSVESYVISGGIVSTSMVNVFSI